MWFSRRRRDDQNVMITIVLQAIPRGQRGATGGWGIFLPIPNSAHYKYHWYLRRVFVSIFVFGISSVFLGVVRQGARRGGKKRSCRSPRTGRHHHHFIVFTMAIIMIITMVIILIITMIIFMRTTRATSSYQVMSPWIEGNCGMEEAEGSLTDIVTSLRGERFTSITV